MNWQAYVNEIKHAVENSHGKDWSMVMSIYRDRAKQRHGFTLVELLVVIAIIGILISMMLPAIQSAREAGRRASCQNNIKQLATAMLSYESAFRHFPPGLIGRNDGSSATEVLESHAFGWGTAILGQLESNAEMEFLKRVSDGFRTPRWWDPENEELDGAEVVLPVFMCPSDNLGRRNKMRNFFGNHGKSNYVGVIGPKLFKELKEINDLSDLGGRRTGPVRTDEERIELEWPGILFPNSKTRISKIRDGTSNTFLIGERDGKTRGASTWCGTDRLSWVNNQLGCTSADPRYTINCVATELGTAWASFGSMHNGGAYFARADGSVEFISDQIDGRVYERLGEKSGGGRHNQ